jgi:hypothetical protein
MKAYADLPCGIAPTRYAFISRQESVAFAITCDESGGNLPSEIDGNAIKWIRIDASHGEVFSLLSTPDMERDLHEAEVHITETRTKPRGSLGRKSRSLERCEGAAGSLATLAPGRGPSHPRSTSHGSRLPAISRSELRSGIYPRGSDLASGREKKGDVRVDRPTCHGGTGAPIKSAPD